MAGRIETVTLLPLSYSERYAPAAVRSARAAQFLDWAFGGIAAGALDRDTRTHANALMGARLVDAVLSELRKQAGWYDGPLRFTHFRDKDGVEVDVVMESERGQLVGIEIKVSATVSAADFIGLNRLRRALETMLRFYGLELRGNVDKPQVVRSASFAARVPVWISLRNHNHDRLTRILKCLSIVEASELGHPLLQTLLEIAAQNPEAFSQETLGYWKASVAAPEQPGR